MPSKQDCVPWRGNPIFPRVLNGILEKRFAWHDMVAEAAVKGDRGLALQALLLDEMAVWPDQAEAMLDELLEASRSHLAESLFA